MVRLRVWRKEHHGISQKGKNGQGQQRESGGRRDIQLEK